MADIFKIETEQTQLIWSPPKGESRVDSEPPKGRLAITPSDSSQNDFRIWRAGIPAEVASNLEIKVGPRLLEETAYSVLLLGKDNRKVELRQHDPTIVQGLHSANDGTIFHGSINFKSQIGTSSFSVYVDGKREYEFEVEVFPSKLDYVADYDAIVADIQEFLPGLVFEYLRSTFKLGFATDSDNPSRLEWMFLLRHVIDHLEGGLRYIEQHPHHDLIGKRVSTRAEKVRRPDATISRLVVQGKGTGPKSRGTSGRELPSRLPERRAQMTWDALEHRWLSSQLNRIRQTLVEIQAAERKTPSHNKARQILIMQELADFENRIAALQSIEPIRQAKGFIPAGFTSLTLQSKPGYREAYRACVMLLQGLRVDGGPVGLSVKEIHQLYEYWCYLTLVRLLAKITGEPIPVRQLFSIESDGLRVRLKRGETNTLTFPDGERTLELTYNPKYKDDSFVLSQKPDLVLTIRDPRLSVTRLIFDAKYRIRTDASYLKQWGSPGPPQDSIDALHRYRDAIMEVTGKDGPRSERCKQTVIEGVVFFPHVDLDDEFKSSLHWTRLEGVGIGAIPFLPRETRYVEEWLRKVLRESGKSLAERTIPHPAHEQLRSWLQEAKETVLVGVLRPDAHEHLDWIKLARCYYTVLIPSQDRQLNSQWVAIYSPASIRTPGAVTHLAPVKNIDVKYRREIDTPWQPTGGANEQQVVYQLGELQELPNPIENRGRGGSAKRFSHNRWTSRLGITMAHEVRELLLETSPEWELYEQLRRNDLDFTLKPGPAKLPDEKDLHGRAWFVVKDYRVQYRGAAGFLIRRTGRPNQFCTNVDDVLKILTAS